MAALTFNIAEGPSSLGVRSFLKCNRPYEIYSLRLHELRQLKNITDEIYKYDDDFGRGKLEAQDILERAIRIQEKFQLRIIRIQLKYKLTEKIINLQQSKIFIILLLFVALLFFICKMASLGITTTNQQQIFKMDLSSWCMCFSAGFVFAYEIGAILLGSCCRGEEQGFIDKMITKIKEERDKL